MLDIIVGNYTKIGEEDVMLIAHGHGLYGAEHEDGHVKYEMTYTYQFSLEELIASAAVNVGIEFFKKYGEECELTTLRIMGEYDYEQYQKQMAQMTCRNCKYFSQCGDIERTTPCEGKEVNEE